VIFRYLAATVGVEKRRCRLAVRDGEVGAREKFAHKRTEEDSQ